jgi:hypothetical protein
VITTLSNFELSISRLSGHTVDYPVLTIDSPRPPSGVSPPKWFGLAYPGERRARRLLDEDVETRGTRRVCFLPMQIVSPTLRREGNLHRLARRRPFANLGSTKVRGVTSPRSAALIDP